MKRKALLEELYQQINDIVLVRQHPVTGLLPASTSVNSHGNYTDAWVRDNVYSIMCVWGLSMAFKRVGDTERCDELEQATAKLMRNLLQSMMRQAHKVEKFKETLNAEDALHAKYETASGLEVVGDLEWGHLQIDATSLYLLTLAQMSASGLRIIKTYSEVDFIQNLVYYIASAYRIEDFGIWERGNKINNGKTEINASSVGMAKAALHALDGFNLFGVGASRRAVIHTVADAIALADNTLRALLPRESLSKETDSALLSVIGFPAFAVGDKALITKTRDNILAKLGGKYGCKRFLWDGHQTAIEERSRLYYEHSELVNFEHIESEWPLFFTYLYIHALFDGNQTTASYYREKIESLMVDVDGQKLIPELYFLPEDVVAAEKNEPGSQKRVPNENVPLVWAQSLYLLGLMLDEGLIDRQNLDALKMRSRALRLDTKHMALVVLAENEDVKAMLSKHGVIAETLTEIEPIGLLSAPELMEVYAHVGENAALGLTGRNRRRLQSLVTSQTYTLNGKHHLVQSWLQSHQSDYRNMDAHYVAHNIQREIRHIRTHWMNREVAVFTWLVDAAFCQTPDASEVFNTLRALQLKSENEQIGYASAALAQRASRKNRFVLADVQKTAPLAYSAVIEPAATLEELNALFDESNPLTPEVKALVECLQVETQETCLRTLEVFLIQHPNQDPSKQKLLEYIYQVASSASYWSVARVAYVALGYFPLGLVDDLVMLFTRHVSLTLGKDRVNTFVVEGAIRQDTLKEVLGRLYHAPLERALAIELLTVLGTFARTQASWFNGMRSVQLQKLMLICADADESADDRALMESLGQMSPYALMTKLESVFSAQHHAFTQELSLDLGGGTSPAWKADVVATDWLAWRAMRGSITRLDDNFLEAIWQSLAQVQTLVFADTGSQDCCLDAEAVRSSMTSGEASFATLIDGLLQHLHPPYYKSAALEALNAFTIFCRQHPQQRLDYSVSLARLLERAAKSYVWDSGLDQLAKRDLDVLLEQDPQTLQNYVLQGLQDMAGIQNES